MFLRSFAAGSSRLRAFSVQTSTKLHSLARWQESASWHHTCISTTASDQLHPDAMLTSSRWREKDREVESQRGKQRHSRGERRTVGVRVGCVQYWEDVRFKGGAGSKERQNKRRENRRRMLSDANRKGGRRVKGSQ